MSIVEDSQLSTPSPLALAAGAPRTQPKTKRTLPDWRQFHLVEKQEREDGLWVPIRSFTKRTARAAAQTVAYKTESPEIAILDCFSNRITVFRAVKEAIPEEKRSATQKARSITHACKVYVKGHYKLESSNDLCEPDRRGRRPPNVAVVETSRADANE